MSFAVVPAVRRANPDAVPLGPVRPRKRGSAGRSGDGPDLERPRASSGLSHAIRAWLAGPGAADADKGRDTRTKRR